MNPKTETVLVIGGAAIAVVVAIALAGRTNSSGVAFAAADPNSVAAVENGLGAQITANNQLALQRTQAAASTILGLAQLQQGLMLGQIQANDQLQTTIAEVNGATQQTELQTAASTQNTQISSQAAIKIANFQEQAASAAANAQLQAQEYTANQQSQAEQAQAHAQQQSSFWGDITSTIASVLPFFNSSSGGDGAGGGFGSSAPSNGESVYDSGAPIAIVQPNYATSTGVWA